MTSIQMHEDYFDNILSAGYIPTITLPTRLLIDNIFTNNVSNQNMAGTLDTHISDH